MRRHDACNSGFINKGTLPSCQIVFNGTNPFYSFVQNLPFLGEFYPFWGSANMTHIPKTLICSLSIDFQRAVAEPL